MTREEQIKSLEEKGFDIKVVNKLVSLAWMCSSSAMDATNELDEYMTKYGFKGLFYNDLRAIKRDYEVYAKKIRASISGNEISNFFNDFDTFNAMVHDWAQLEADNKDFSMLSIHLVGDKLKVHKKGLKSLLENKEVRKLLTDALKEE
jgi:acetylglutamate kinase